MSLHWALGGCFSHDYTGVMTVLGERAHKQKVPLSSQHAKGTSTGLITVDIYLDHLAKQSLPGFFQPFLKKIIITEVYLTLTIYN